eukprot:480137-Prymnesium_polylepis.1
MLDVWKPEPGRLRDGGWVFSQSKASPRHAVHCQHGPATNVPDAAPGTPPLGGGASPPPNPGDTAPDENVSTRRGRVTSQ